VLAVLAIDVIFLLYLLLWGGGKRKPEIPASRPSDTLPEVKDVMPEEE